METASPPPDNTWPFPFPAQDWGQTPPSVQAYILLPCCVLPFLVSVWYPQALSHTLT
jgi:hypothetical protein